MELKDQLQHPGTVIPPSNIIDTPTISRHGQGSVPLRSRGGFLPSLSLNNPTRREQKRLRPNNRPGSTQVNRDAKTTRKAHTGPKIGPVLNSQHAPQVRRGTRIKTTEQPGGPLTGLIRFRYAVIRRL